MYNVYNFLSHKFQLLVKVKLTDWLGFMLQLHRIETGHISSQNFKVKWKKMYVSIVLKALLLCMEQSQCCSSLLFRIWQSYYIKILGQTWPPGSWVLYLCHLVHQQTQAASITSLWLRKHTTIMLIGLGA